MFDQVYVEPGVETKVTDPPWQNVLPFNEEIDATGSALTVTTVAADVVEQPFAFVTVTE